MTLLLATLLLSKPIPLKLDGVLSWEAKVSMTFLDPTDSSDTEIWEYKETAKVVSRKPLLVEIGRIATRNAWGGLELPMPSGGEPFTW